MKTEKRKCFFWFINHKNKGTKIEKFCIYPTKVRFYKDCKYLFTIDKIKSFGYQFADYYTNDINTFIP